MADQPRTTKVVAIVAVCAAVLAWALPAVADEVILQDGRQFHGQVLAQGDVVAIRTAEGELSFPAEQVAEVRVQLPGATGDPPPPAPDSPATAPADAPPAPASEAELHQRLMAVSPRDAAGLFEVAQWAARNGLERHAAELFEHVLDIDAAHEGAHRAVRHVRIGTRWYTLTQAAELLSGQLSSAGLTAELAGTVEQMRALADTAEEQAAVNALSAHVRLCQGAFAEAAAMFARLAEAAPPDSGARARLTAIAEILLANPDGLYVLTEPYPAEAALLDRAVETVPPGPASLSDPRVLSAALRDRARAAIAQGARGLDQARAAENVDPRQAEQAYLSAIGQFDKADALVADIARGYRVDATRRRIDLLRRRAQDAAERFDQELAELGRQDLTRQAYADRLTKMLAQAKRIEQDLGAIVAIAQALPRDMVMELHCARQDRQRMRSIMATLRQELYEAR